MEPSADKGEPGVFSKLFSGSKADTGPLKLRIAIVSKGSASTVSVQNATGAADNSPNAQRILKVIADDLQ